MGLPPRDGLAVLYVLADRWTRERQILTGLGLKDRDALDDALADAAAVTDRRDPDKRRAQIAAFVDEVGGEIGG